jgi:large subunit ribosomal protein L9
MKVILTEKVSTLGNVGEIVNVSAGFGRNYLIPSKKAVLADEGNKKVLDNEQKRLAKKVAEQVGEAQALKAKLDGVTLELVKKVGGNGSLFGTVTTGEIAKELANNGIEIERRIIHMDNSIKNLGSYEVKAKLFKDVEAIFKVKIEMDPKQAEELKKKQETAAARKKAKKEAKSEETAVDASEEAVESSESTESDA